MTEEKAIVPKRVKKEVETKRVYSANMKLDSDLFKLEITMMKKNIGYNNDKHILADVEHCHFYRTVDSNGRSQKNSSYVGGHSHDIEVFEVFKDGENHLKAKCSPAKGSKFVDTHVHNVHYVRSDKIYRRKLNEEAQLAITNRERV